MNIRLFATLSFLILLNHAASAQIGGSSVYQFLALPSSPALAALGGDGVAGPAEDLSRTLSNPALFNPLQDNKLSFNHAFYYTGINFGSLIFARHLDKHNLTFGGGLQYISYGKMPGYNLYGTPLGDFTAGEYALSGSVSREIAPNLRAGVGLKFIGSFLESYRSFGAALDVGLLYSDSLGLNLMAISIQNLGTQLSTYSPGEKEKLPLNVKVGFVKKLSNAPFRFYVSAHHLQRLDIQYYDPAAASASQSGTLFGDTTQTARDRYSTGDRILAHIIIGTELLMGKNLRLRVGYNHLRRQELKLATRSGMTGFSFGAGIFIKHFRIDYAVSVYHLAGATHQLGISTNLEEFIPGLN